MPHATEKVQWGDDLLFCIGGKMFAITCLDPAVPQRLAFKCDPEVFAQLVEQESIIPAPYMARHHWVALQQFDALSDGDIQELVRHSYDLVFGKLPAKTRQALQASTRRESSRKKPTRKRRRK
ncbi:MAG: MmcQ/YjbR family DNA-binding protein [Acidobacteria bacterium]|nr:MmcQ/YjbR family DNA-binding protein [Acidobacteriota bacterium]MBI3263976.1 MmcQ/YjbR family DNA-binding protein [Acidobacteriota bacterium]